MLGKALLTAATGMMAEETLGVEDVFSTFLYTGTSSAQTITNGIDLAGKGGLVWIKNRTNAVTPRLFDTARGPNLSLDTTTTSSNVSGWFPGFFTGFTSTGFGLSSTSTSINTSGDNYASWTFRKAPKFFDVVTYTGTGSTQSIAHNLGSVPGCIIVKRLNSTSDWAVYHRGTGTFDVLTLNSAAAKISNVSTYFDGAPSSTHFGVRTASEVNGGGDTYVAYLFAHDAGGFGDSGNESVIKCGSYIGNGSTQEINLGWEPQWLLVKNTSIAGGWSLFDTMRGCAVDTTVRLRANDANAEASYSTLRPRATGFEIYSGNYEVNSSGNQYIYIAIRRGPMKTPTAGTDVFSSIATVSDTTNIQQAGFPVDLVLAKQRTGNNPPTLGTRLLGRSYLTTDSTSTEAAWPYIFFDSNIGYRVSTTGTFFNASSTTNLFFRRAPGFFDVVAYTGTGSARTVSHNLGVAPELMIVKSRSSGPSSPEWWVYCSAMSNPATSYLHLQGSGGRATGVTVLWNSTNPTSSVFSLGTYDGVNGNTYTYIAYLFASVPGVSKVGSYTGTGTTLDIDCGFTNGARFVLIKRTDSTGDWFVFDTARGIFAGNDPWLALNSTGAEVNNNDNIDAYAPGFSIPSTAIGQINLNGGQYIFLAIA